MRDHTEIFYLNFLFKNIEKFFWFKTLQRSDVNDENLWTHFAGADILCGKLKYYMGGLMRVYGSVSEALDNKRNIKVKTKKKNKIIIN